MDGSHFDTWTRRRFGLASGGLATALLGLGLVGRDPTRLTAKQRHKRRKPLVFNEIGCLNVGAKCRGKDKLCCSGICQGKKPKQGKRDKGRCVAHDTGGCTAADRVCPSVLCTTSIGRAGGCMTTTGNAPYCADIITGVPCNKDAECRTFCGPLAACYVCNDGEGGRCAGPGDCDTT